MKRTIQRQMTVIAAPLIFAAGATLLSACATVDIGGGTTHRWAINLAGTVGGTANRTAELTEFPNGTAIWTIRGAGIHPCDQGAHRAQVFRKKSTTGVPIIVVQPDSRMVGCEPVLFVMLIDGSGGWSEVNRDGNWVRLDGGLGLTALP